jgi:hypothetical protein
MESLYQTAGAMVADDRWNPSWVSSGIDKQMLQWTKDVSSISLYYIAPPVIDEWIWPAAGQLYTASSTPEQIAALGEETLASWRTANPEIVKLFKVWATANK